MITTRNSAYSMQYLMSRRSYKGLTRQNSNENNRTSKESQERINNVNKIIEKSKTSKLSANQIETLKSAVKDGLLGSSTNKLGLGGMHTLKKFSSNSKYNSTVKAYRNSI
ncbi:hypothetical protein [Lysinibacillus xylanilyticus]|uniref:Uncharacterized protein n=1 Tax=Lysinibacillus xylanilyticus TaxID=582475 RepID=A0ABT4EX86_9BACI|nr:hypothetical protein [Lysinibacillus xylanilyticus]MCY9549096.1 hypothetical protein [Lysinibacillus xylanilyticus]MED3804704.1 hypothetical protein [Lysinibacillus xylanilyticus]